MSKSEKLTSLEQKISSILIEFIGHMDQVDFETHGQNDESLFLKSIMSLQKAAKDIRALAADLDGVDADTQEASLAVVAGLQELKMLTDALIERVGIQKEKVEMVIGNLTGKRQASAKLYGGIASFCELNDSGLL